MPTAEPQNAGGVPGSTDPKVTTPVAAPKVEVKDGKVLVDGHSYVKESDLIAAKESLQRQLNEQQTVHSTAIDALKLEVSNARGEVAKANARLQEAEKARTTGAISAEELAKVKKEATDAQAALATAQKTGGLEYRRKYIMAAYNIPADSDVGKKLAEKDSAALDAFEEAIKALGGNSGNGGPGRYMVGGTGGGAGAVSPLDRAKAILAATPVRGTRTAATK